MRRAAVVLCRQRLDRALPVQALRMLRGIPAAGPGLALARDDSSVHPVAGVHVPHLSLGSLRAVLQRFARAATHALRSASHACWPSGLKL